MISLEYPKTPNLFARDADTHVVIQQPKVEFSQIATWLVTEKIDGTNIRLVLDATDIDGRLPVVRGRSDNANLPPDFQDEALSRDDDDLRDHLRAALELIQPDRNLEDGARYSMIVFGEGYGPGIQKNGGGYADKKSLRIFDVATFKTVYRPTTMAGFSGTGTLAPVTSGPLWRPFTEVQTVAEALGLETAPVVSWFQRMDTIEVIRYVREDKDSIVARVDNGVETPDGAVRGQEGVVARTDPYLYDFRGDRVMFKLKGKDLR